MENRSWRTSHRGPLAIHAGKSMAAMDRENAAEWPERYGVALPGAGELTFGAIIAVVEVRDCVLAADLPTELRGHSFAKGPWCWVLDVVERVESVKCAGKQMIWECQTQLVSSIGKSDRRRLRRLACTIRSTGSPRATPLAVAVD